MLLFHAQNVQMQNQSFIRLYGSGCGDGRLVRLNRVLDNFAETQSTKNLLYLHDHKGWLTVSSVQQLRPREQSCFRGLWAGENEDDDCVDFGVKWVHPGLSCRDDDEFGIWTENK